MARSALIASLSPVAVVLPLLWLAGCGDDDRIPPDTGPGDMDSGPPDSGPPDSGPADAGPPDTGVPGCAADGGIECDGDWEGRCAATCAMDECCSPTGGSFACLPRHADGTCPAADLWADATRIDGNYSVEWRFFPDGDCSIVEGCVDAGGWRRLLRFSTWTPNTGDADMFLGVPREEPDHFDYSSCHGHYHFNTYARYQVMNADDTVAATGHKQAFCLLDFYHYPGTDGSGAVYSCSRQGIEHGWQDVYGRGLDCQWVDVTDVAAGDYTLQVDINFEHLIKESDYSNNTIRVPVTIPPDDPMVDITLPCAGSETGTGRNCGFTRAGDYTCTPGAMVTLGCSATCGLGTCTGDPFIRVCDLADVAQCTGRYVLGANDDSGCGMGRCGRGGDCCSQAQVTCPDSGEYVVFWAAFNPDVAATCDIMTM